MHNLQPGTRFVGLNVLGDRGERLQRRVLGKENNLCVVNFVDSSGRVSVEVGAHELREMLAVEVREDAKQPQTLEHEEHEEGHGEEVPATQADQSRNVSTPM
jgi:hypothetical protein